MSSPHLSPQELKSVSKPAQYLGGEIGSVLKKDCDLDLHFCLAFPDTYEVGMSHIGMQILYDIINKDPKAWAERAYAPLPDMEALLRKRDLRLCSLESKRELKDFDIVGFSLQYELCATGILLMLDLGGIPLLASERLEDDPIVIGGGPVCYHPEPFSDFFDCFAVGDGEELVPQFMQAVREAKQLGLSRSETLKHITKVKGIYVPSLFEPEYDQDKNFRKMHPLLEGYTQIQNQVLASLEGAPYPTKPIIPNISAVHDRLSVEVMRGCVRGCRFCQAGYLYRPKESESLRIY